MSKKKVHIVNNRILRKFCSQMLFENVCCFRDIRGKGFHILLPSIPNHVTNDLNIDIDKFTLAQETLTCLETYIVIKIYRNVI